METVTQHSKVDTRRVAIFLALAFGIAWITGLIIYLNGGLVNSPKLAPGIPLALILLAVPYMWAPATANILTRLITREGWKDVGLRPHFRQGWPYWLAGWVVPGILTILGAAVFFLLFPQYFDASLSALRQSLSKSPLGTLSPWMFVAVEAMAGIVISPILNAIATFGEEFGWRAYLLPKLMPLGWKRAVLLMGVIWGVWHWPVIFMGYEYGFKYPGYPWAGPLLFVLIAFSFGTFLAWITLRGGSVWPAVIGHAAINGIAALAALAVKGTPNPLVGPLPVGIVGAIGYEALALILFFSPLGKVRLPAAVHDSES
jgi:membrane protease YdiL (CAAX protease family)